MTAERLHAHLHRSPNLGQGLLARAARLADLDRAFRDWLAPLGPWARHVRLANLATERVALISTSAAAMTPLRYRQAEILAWFEAHAEARFTRLNITVRSSDTSRRRGV